MTSPHDRDQPDADSARFVQEQIDRFLDSIDPAFRVGGQDGQPQTEEEIRNTAALHTIFRAVGEGDFDSFAAVLHDDVLLEIDGPPSVPYLGAWHGRKEVAKAARDNFGMLEDQETELLSLSAQGSHIVMILRERGRYIPTGLPYVVRCVQVFTFVDDRIDRIREILVEEPAD